MVHGYSTLRSMRFFRFKKGGLSRHRRLGCSLGFVVRSSPLSIALRSLLTVGPVYVRTEPNRGFINLPSVTQL